MKKRGRFPQLDRLADYKDEGDPLVRGRQASRANRTYVERERTMPVDELMRGGKPDYDDEDDI